MEQTTAERQAYLDDLAAQGKIRPYDEDEHDRLLDRIRRQYGPALTTDEILRLADLEVLSA